RPVPTASAVDVRTVLSRSVYNAVLPTSRTAVAASSCTARPIAGMDLGSCELGCCRSDERGCVSHRLGILAAHGISHQPRSSSVGSAENELAGDRKICTTARSAESANGACGVASTVPVNDGLEADRHG